MNDKWILIVDDEEAVLTILQKSLKRLGPEYHVVTVNNGFLALEKLRLQPFDLIITDYKMGGMNGLELLDHIKSEQPNARVILMTAYGNSSLETKALRKKAYRYMTKPLEISAFRQIVQDSLNDLVVSRPGFLILSDTRYRQIDDLLQQLQDNVGARCVFLMDSEGHTIVRAGQIDSLAIEQIAPLMSAGIATLSEAGRVLDGDPDAINLAYREGPRENLCAINIGAHLLLLIIIDRSAFSSRLGSVWYYAQQTAVLLRRKLGEEDQANPKPVLGKQVYQAIDSELDKLFELFPETDPAMEKPIKADSDNQQYDGSVTINYEEAVEKGIISSLLYPPEGPVK